VILGPSQVKYLVAGQALWCIPGACQVLNREAPRLAHERLGHRPRPR